MFVPLMLSYTCIIDLKVYAEITTSLVVRHVLNLHGPDSLIAYDVLFSARVETLIPPKT